MDSIFARQLRETMKSQNMLSKASAVMREQMRKLYQVQSADARRITVIFSNRKKR